MSERDFRLFLADIRDGAARISTYVKGKSFEDFRRAPMMRDAVVRNLEIIGEAARHLPAKIKQRHPQIEWKKLTGLRNIVVHEYFGINDRIVWDIVQNKIPDLMVQIKKVVEKETGEGS